MSDITLLSLQIFSYAAAGVIGFILGRTTGHHATGYSGAEKRAVLPRPEIKQKKEVLLDSRTFVTSISTDSLTNKNGDIGTSTTVEDDVESSVSKLAKLKKNK